MSRQINSISTMKGKACLILLALCLSTCSKDYPQIGPALMLHPSVDGEYVTRATVPDVPSLMEDDLSGGLYVYLSGHGVFLKYPVSSPLNGGLHFLTTQWRDDGVIPGQTYDVYVIANSKHNPAQIGSMTDLQALTEGPDADIYRLYDPLAATYDLALTREKVFLMDGHTQWIPTDENEQVIDVTLRRAASKIQVNFSLSPSLSEYHISGTPQWKLVNYAVTTAVLGSSNPTSVVLSSTPILMNVSDWSSVGGSITTYSYPSSWNDGDDALCIILNVPLEDNMGNQLNQNYYCFPVVDQSGAGPYSVERNTLYRVDVLLDAIGSSGENATDRSLGLTYRVLPWVYNTVTDDINVVGRELEYLMIDPVKDEIREKVLAQSHMPRVRHLNFWASGPIAFTTPEVYYFDKTNTRIDASALSPVTLSVNGLKNGTIDVTTRALENNTVKYIRFRVYLADNPSIYEDIEINHFPLDYIKNIEGLWSSLTTSNWVDWEQDQTPHSPARTVSNSIFSAKVYDSGGIYYITEQRSGGSSYQAVRGNRLSNLSNNRMYVVQITSSSDNYTLGRVTLDGNYQSQDHLVSPAFMIASQLGATQTTTNALTAASHCHTYKEVTASGTAYTGWRLPTREEIGIIMGYQYDSDAIDEVLSGSHYWTLEGKAVSKTNYADISSDASSGYIRCVRDIPVSELAQINQHQ